MILIVIKITEHDVQLRLGFCLTRANFGQPLSGVWLLFAVMASIIWIVTDKYHKRPWCFFSADIWISSWSFTLGCRIISSSPLLFKWSNNYTVVMCFFFLWQVFAPLRLDPRVVVLIRGASFQVLKFTVFCFYQSRMLYRLELSQHLASLIPLPYSKGVAWGWRIKIDYLVPWYRCEVQVDPVLRQQQSSILPTRQWPLSVMWGWSRHSSSARQT